MHLGVTTSILILATGASSFSSTRTSTTPTFLHHKRTSTLFGSIYAPDGSSSAEEDEGLERDHLGMLKPSQPKVTFKAGPNWGKDKIKDVGVSSYPKVKETKQSRSSSRYASPPKNIKVASSTNVKSDSDSSKSKQKEDDVVDEKKGVIEVESQKVEESKESIPVADAAVTTAEVESPTSPSPSTNDLVDGKVPVRFVNYERKGGSERLAYAKPGTNLLKIADEAGVRIPYNCRSGLCGSCTADVKDPTWTEGDRVGFQTVRTCQTGAMLPAGCEEMIIDCFRSSKEYNLVESGDEGVEMDGGGVGMTPMMNFDDGWESDFSPDYKSGGVEVLKKTTPEYTVKQGRRSSIEIEKPHWTPRIDSNIPPWETVW